MTPIIMVVLDGASDRPDGEWKTPLEAATTPNLDALVQRGALGSMYTVGKGIAPESDAGVFSLLGYDPLQIHISRGVVESIGAKGYDIPKCDPMDDSPEAVKSAALVNEFGFKTRQVLDTHSVNQQRRKQGKKPANFVLMRDAGTTRPDVQGFREKWGLKAVMIADLPAELGIGRLLGMNVREIPPGTSLEDYRKRAELVLRLAGEYDFVYVHLKGPDEPGHDGLYDLKKQRIEEIDSGFFSHLRMAAKLQRTLLCVT